MVDPSSIEVNRRQRRAKTDRLDVKKLLQMLMRYRLYGEKAAWKVVHVPTEEQEDELRLHREVSTSLHTILLIDDDTGNLTQRTHRNWNARPCARPPGRGAPPEEQCPGVLRAGREGR